jgi:hypothetical protein
MIDPQSEVDPDTITRAQALDAAMWLADTTQGVIVESLDDFLVLAMSIEHYLNDGATVSFDCKEEARKFVRGM